MADKRKVYPIQLGELVWAGRCDINRPHFPGNLNVARAFLC
jgi:hypothetical protein